MISYKLDVNRHLPEFGELLEGNTLAVLQQYDQSVKGSKIMADLVSDHISIVECQLTNEYSECVEVRITEYSLEDFN